MCALNKKRTYLFDKFFKTEAQSQIDEAANNLIKINREIIEEGGKPAKSLCVICGLVNAAYKRQDGVYVVPFTSLKN